MTKILFDSNGKLNGLETSDDPANDTVGLSNIDLLNLFISSKKIEGKSKKTCEYYKGEILQLCKNIDKKFQEITTTDLRFHLTESQKKGNSNVTLDNKRRALNSFFGWLELEEYIFKNPIKKIKSIKADKIIKKPFSEIEIETMRTYLNENGREFKVIRNKAIFELLLSSGIRVGELVNIKLNEFNLNEKELLVFGKGSKERMVYFNVKTQIALENYLKVRPNVDHEFLFTAIFKPFNPLAIGGVGTMFRDLGKACKIDKVHPHRFRRTMATNCINHNMNLEEIKELLGHSNMDTTLMYAMINQSKVKNSYQTIMG